MPVDSSPDPDIRVVTVFRTSDPALIAVVKSVLDEAGIDYFVSGETIRNVMGWGSLAAAGAGEADFQVREEDAASTTQLLARLER
jgi:hypothetical protein